jgi:hypothetical protein
MFMVRDLGRYCDQDRWRSRDAGWQQRREAAKRLSVSALPAHRRQCPRLDAPVQQGGRKAGAGRGEQRPAIGRDDDEDHTRVADQRAFELLREDFEVRRGAQFFQRVLGELQLPGQDAEVLLLKMALDRVTDQDAEQQQNQRRRRREEQGQAKADRLAPDSLHSPLSST